MWQCGTIVGLKYVVPIGYIKHNSYGFWVKDISKTELIDASSMVSNTCRTNFNQGWRNRQGNDNITESLLASY